MKTSLKLSLLALVLALPMAATAQQNAIKLNLFSPVVRTGSIFYERGFNDNMSAQLGVFYTFGVNTGNSSFNGFGITPEFRYYPAGNGMRGFYLAPFARYQSFTLKSEYNETDINGIEREVESSATLTSVGGGLVVGGQWLFGDRVAFDIFAGPSFRSNTLTVEAGSNEEKVDIGILGNGVGVRFGLSIGVAF